MNWLEKIDMSRYARRATWVMLIACATRFSAERDLESAWRSFVLWVLVIAAAVWIRSAISRADNARSKLEKSGNAVALIGLIVFVVSLSGGAMIPALLTLLLTTQIAMFIAAEKRLHLLLILAAAFGNVLFAAAESRSALFLICSAWFILAAFGLLAFDVRVAREADAQCKPLWRTSSRSGGAVFTLTVLLIAVPLYLFLPKPEGLMFGGMQARTAHDYREDATSDVKDYYAPDSSSESGRLFDGDDDNDASAEAADDSDRAAPLDEESFDVSEVQRDRALANDIVLYVKSSQPVHLRGKIYERFEGHRWYRSTHAVEQRELNNGNWQREESVGSMPIDQTVEVVRDIDSTLVHAPGLVRLRFPAPSIREYDDGVFELPREIRAGTTYSVASRVDVLDGRYVDVGAKRRLMTHYLSVPAEISERIRALAKGVVEQANAGTPFEKAVALEEHLRTQYEYSFDTIRYQGYTPLDKFLFDEKRGHCEYFASALAIMLRTVGVPSRMTTGFSLGARNPITGFYEVRNLHGHAWVEAYIPERGWLMLEPTPLYPLPIPESQSKVADGLDRYLEQLAQDGRTLDPQSFKTQVVVFLRDAWSATRHLSKQAMNAVVSLGWRLPAGVLALGCAALAGHLLVLWLRDIRSNRRVAMLLQERGSVIAVAEALAIAAMPRGFAREPNRTMQEYAMRLPIADLSAAGAFANAFDEACYGMQTGRDASAIQTMSDFVQATVTQQRYPRVRQALTQWRDRLRMAVNKS